MCRLNPKVDFAFKKLFGSPENKDILISFINSMLSENQQIKDIELKNPYNIANYMNGKMSILDIMYLDKEEREIYENDLKRLRDYKAELKTAEIKGREEGKEEGREEGREEERRQLILKQYRKGLSVEYIADINDLNAEYVKKVVIASSDKFLKQK